MSEDDFQNPVSDTFEDESSEPDSARKGKFGLMGGLGKGLDAVKGGVDGIKKGVQDGVEGAAKATSVKDLMKFADLAVFGSTAEADENEYREQQRLKARWCGLLHPETNVSVAYDMLQMVLLVYLLFTLPYNLAFDLQADSKDPQFWLDLSVDVLLGADMVLNLFRFTVHPRTRDIISDPAVLRKTYLRGWFVLDAIALFPFDYVVRIYSAHNACYTDECVGSRNTARSTRLIRLTKLTRFARLTKLAKLSKLRALTSTITTFMKNLGVTKLGLEFSMRVIGLLFLLIACAHLIGCLWLHVGISSIAADEKAGHGLNWMLSEYGSVAGAESVGNFVRYIDATYWVYVTVSSVGFGDILPFSTGEREYAIFTIIAGTFLYAYIIGTFTNMISNMGQDKSNFDAKMRSISELMKYMNVPMELDDKVQSFYEYKYTNKTMFNASLVDELPVRLRADLVLHRFQETVDKVPFFHGAREDAIVDICAKLKTHAIMPSDDIVQRGEPYRELVVITTGKGRSIPDESNPANDSPRAGAQAKMQNLDAVIEYVEGSFFGELEFLGFSTSRTMTIRAMRYTEVSTLNPIDIEPVLDIHIGLRRRLHRYGKLKKDLDMMLKNEEGIDELGMEQMKERIEGSFNDNEESELKGIWDEVDVDKSGTLSADEFLTGLATLGIILAPALIHDAFESLDKGGTGEIHFEDFQAWWIENENKMRASHHDETVSDSVRDTQRRVANVESSVDSLQEDMDKLLTLLRDKR